MFTPQEIQEKTFVKAVFGGYDMQTVDEFLEPLTEDYVALYKENAVLKSKMKILVTKLEEYRDQEESMKKAILSAQRTCDVMLQEATRKCAEMMNDAEGAVRTKPADVEHIISEEEARIRYAKETAQNFICVIERDVKGHLELLESLKNRDLSGELAAENGTAKDSENTAKSIASEIQQSLGKIGVIDADEEDPPVIGVTHPDSATKKFDNLMFGRNYNPTNK